MTLYQKIGRRYHPVRETDAYEGLTEGAWLVIVKPGCTTMRRAVEPDAAVYAAAEVAREPMLEAMRKACELRPKATALTEREKRAIAAYNRVMGDAHPLMVQGSSIAEVVDVGIDALVQASKTPA